MLDVYHITSHTRLSCFSACNIDKLRMGLHGDEANNNYGTLYSTLMITQLMTYISWKVQRGTCSGWKCFSVHRIMADKFKL